MDGPGSTPIATTERPPMLYALVRVDTSTADLLNGATMEPITAFLEDRRPAPGQLVLRPGDEVAVTIVNTSQAGFIDFTQSTVSPLAATNLPSQAIGPDGRISVPPIGRFTAAGRTPQELENALRARLAEVLIEPSVIVRLTGRLNGQVAVMGQVESAGAFSILTENTRLLDVIGAAGGPTERAEELDLVLTRNGQQTRVRFDRFLERPDWNIVAWPGDVIRFEPPNRRYTILGAVTLNGEFSFEEPTLSLAQALGRGRGLVNTEATRNGIFVYRTIPRTTLDQLSIRPLPFDSEWVPTIFHFDLAQPAVLFAAQRFRIEDGDMIYVPDAPLTEFSKVLSVFNLGVGGARNVFLIGD